MNDQQKIELGRWLQDQPSYYSGDNKETDRKVFYIKAAESVLNKIQELTHNHENNEPEHKNAPPDNTEVGQYQTTGEKHHVCGCCYQSYPAKYLERNFMTCNPCKDTGKERPTCLDKNGKMFTSGDVLKNEKSSVMIQVLQIESTSISYCRVGKSDSFGCSDKQDFIDAGWIVHERVTPYEVGPTDFGTIKCRFKNFMIGDPGCIICDHCMGVNSEQQWVICERYNKENEG